MSESVVISDTNDGELIDLKVQYQNRYVYTKMKQNFDSVTIFNNDITNPINEFNEETMFHYCNVILDLYNNQKLNLGIFRDDIDYGPKQDKVDIYFHPFRSKSEWHLAIGFYKYSKILIVHCSNFTSSVGELYPSFPRKTSIKIQGFIHFFKQKLSKNALKYPRLFSDLFEPVTGNNAVNLLAVIFSFCLDAVALQRSFCDPYFSPSKFEISDIYPLLENIDNNYRSQLQESVFDDKEETNGKLTDSKMIEEEKIGNKFKEEDKQEYVEKFEEEVVEESMNSTIESDGSRIGNHSLPRSDRSGDSKSEEDNNSEENEESLENQLIDKNIMIVKNEFDYERTNEEIGKGGIERLDDEREIDLKKSKMIQQVFAEEINDLESSEEIEEESKDTTERLIPSINREKIAKIENIFLPIYAEDFETNIHNKTKLHDGLNLDLMFEFIGNTCKNPLTNPQIFDDKEKKDKFMKKEFKIRKCLIATYMKGSKLEFDEDQFSRMLIDDYKNQIFPIIFINDSIFLVNIKTSDNLNCIVRIFCISNRTNRSEREILRNYALRRLVEMYVFKFHRLVTKITLCLVPVKSMELYKVLMQAVFIVHKVMWRNKFDLNMRLNSEDLDNYILFFENIMKNIQRKDIFQIELNWKRLVKHVLAKYEKKEVIQI